MRTALRLAAVLVLTGLALGVAAGAAQAAGPGVRLYAKSNTAPIDISGGLVSGSAGAARTYRLPASAGGGSITVATVSIRQLLSGAGINPDNANFVQVVRGSGDALRINRSQFSASVVGDDGSTTVYFRPAGGVAQDYVGATSGSGPLEISVDGGPDVVVKAEAAPTTVKAGVPVTFNALVEGGRPGAQYTYEWDFGDGRTEQGVRVAHTYYSGGERRATVSVTNIDPSCSTSCGGVAFVDVSVGPLKKQNKPPAPSAGDPNGGLGAGSSTGTGDGGQGGTGTGTGSGSGSDFESDAEGLAAAEKVAGIKPAPKPKKPFGVTISGVLINDPGTALSKLPEGKKAGGGAKGERRISGGDPPKAGELSLGGAFAFALVMLGALRERRGVRLRVA